MELNCCPSSVVGAAACRMSFGGDFANIVQVVVQVLSSKSGITDIFEKSSDNIRVNCCGFLGIWRRSRELVEGSRPSAGERGSIYSVSSNRRVTRHNTVPVFKEDASSAAVPNYALKITSNWMSIKDDSS